MKKLSTLLAVACMCSLAVSAATAGPGCCMKDAKDAKMVKASGQCTKSGEACASMTQQFPAMKVVVGDQSYCWESQMADAYKAMKAPGAKPVFVVNSKEYTNAAEAFDAYVCAAECYKTGFMSVSYQDGDAWKMVDMDCCTAGTMEGKSCCAAKSGMTSAKAGSCAAKAEGTAMAKGEGCAKSGEAMAKVDYAKFKKFRVAGHEYTSYADAVAAQKRAVESVKQVKMAYEFDGKTVDCESKVCPTAMKDGKVMYVIGTEKIPCPVTAKVKMAKAQCEAAKKALDSMARA